MKCELCNKERDVRRYELFLTDIVSGKTTVQRSGYHTVYNTTYRYRFSGKVGMFICNVCKNRYTRKKVLLITSIWASLCFIAIELILVREGHHDALAALLPPALLSFLKPDWTALLLGLLSIATFGVTIMWLSSSLYYIYVHEKHGRDTYLENWVWDLKWKALRHTHDFNKSGKSTQKQRLETVLDRAFDNLCNAIGGYRRFDDIQAWNSEEYAELLRKQ